VVDRATFEHHLRRAAGATVEPIDPATFAQRRCETLDGDPVDPDDMLVAAVIGHVRRVVLDSAGVVIDFGRKRRLFDGNVREAIRIADRFCFFPGCRCRSGRCQVDHSTPWSADGTTSTINGGPGCGSHNRHRNRRYRTWRDPDGRWHVYRPNGSEIAPLRTAPRRAPPDSSAA
jgi:hypothetical protein